MRTAGHPVDSQPEPCRLGLAGAGTFGSFLLEALASLPAFTLAAVAARTPGRRAAAAERWRGVRRRAGLPDAEQPVREHADARDLCADPDVQLVLIAVPPDLQPEVAEAAVAAGKPFLLEKPGALSPSRLAAVAERARAAGVTAGVDFVQRAMPLHRALRAWLAEGLLGEPQRLSFENHAGRLPPEHWFWQPEQSGGILVEHGVHFFDLAAWLLDREVTAVTRFTWPHPEIRAAHDRALAVVTYAAEGPRRVTGGVVATFYHAFTRPPGDEYQVLELVGTRGRARVTGWIPARLVAELADGDGVAERAAAALAAATEGLPGEAGMPAPRLLRQERQDGRVWLEAAVDDPLAAYRSAVRAHALALRAAAAGAGEPLAPLAAGVAALEVAAG